MRFVFLFILALNILYFLYPKESQESSRDFQRGREGTPMLVTLAEQHSPPMPTSRVPEMFRGMAAVPVFENETPVSETPEQSEKQAEVKGVTKVAQQLAQQKKSHKPDKAKPQDSKLGCYSLGPFNKKTGAEAISAQLKSLGGKSVNIKIKTEQRNRGYWVYLPSYPSREAAIAAAERLASNGFTDYFVVSGGDHNNSISLGLFTLKQGSERRIQRLSQMGFAPKVEARNEETVVYWVDYRAAKKLDWERNNQSGFEFIGLDHVDIECP